MGSHWMGFTKYLTSVDSHFIQILKIISRILIFDRTKYTHRYFWSLLLHTNFNSWVFYILAHSTWKHATLRLRNLMKWKMIQNKGKFWLNWRRPNYLCANDIRAIFKHASTKMQMRRSTDRVANSSLTWVLSKKLTECLNQSHARYDLIIVPITLWNIATLIE